MYIAHPMRMMLRMAHAGFSEEYQIVAALHDVAEDSDWNLTRLGDEGFSNSVLAAIDALTRRPAEKYLDYVHRAASDPIAREVKWFDLIDNSDPARLERISDAQDRARLEAKYKCGLDALTEHHSK